MNSRDDFTGNRRALLGYGEALLKVMGSVSDTTWAEWLKAPFERAAARGDIELTTVLMEAGAKGNALIPAVLRGRHTLVRNLLEMGVSTSGKNENGSTPLHLAAKSGQGRMVRTLLIEGADVDEPDPRGRSALHLACLSDDAVSVQALLAAGSDASHRHGPTGYAALDFAVHCGKIESSRVLLRKGADINARGRNGQTALHVAVMADQASAIRFLVQQPGINVIVEDKGKCTPLHLAAREGRLRAAKALVDSGVNVHHRTNGIVFIFYRLQENDFSPLDLAASRGHVEVIKALIRRGANVRASSTLYGLTPLHHAAAANRVDAIETLIGAGALVDGPTPDWRPLHLAIEERQLEAIRALVRHGADLHSSHGEGYTPLAQAALQTSGDILDALLAAGADPNITDKEPALHTAARSISPGINDIVRVLLEHGADANAVWDEEQPLHRAMVEGTVGAIDLLVAHGADVDGHDNYLSPLHVACQHEEGSAYCVKISALLGHGADVDFPAGDGNSALHMAAVEGSVEVVDLLLKAGADETLVNEDDLTPADRVRSVQTNHASNREALDSILRLLDGAPADRVWRRRGFLVLCRAFPEKARLESSLRTRAELPRASKRGSAAGRWGSRRASGGVPTTAAQTVDFNNLLARLFRVEEDGIFRNIVSFL